MKLNIAISRLRYNLGLSQEQFAERLNVTRRTIQNWENGISNPDAEKLVLISREFDISIDVLLNLSSNREKEEHYNKIFPNRDRHHWESYEKELLCEYEQSMDEGLDVEKYESLFVEVSKMPQGIYKKKMSDVLYDIVNNADVRANYMYEEPSDLLGIKALRKIDTKPLNGIDDNKLRSKIKGAWCGRIAGCLLGKPIEGIRTPDLNMLLKESGNYPMRRYIVSSDITESVAEKSKFNLKGDKCWADKIECAPADDDTNYTVMASMLIEQHGKDFTPDDVMDMWMNCQPFNAYCTAERVAWRNYFDGYCPPNTAIYKNPYREWIGAQIRADYFGYINPGNPEMAAEMAWRDASVSHIKNGIYGEMFVAAMLAGAAVTDNPEQAIRIGLGQIPSTSRLYEKVMEIINMHNEGVGVDECCCKIHSMFDENSPHGWCHTISNAMIVAMALLYGNDFSSAVGIAVQAGFDTDCNGATVGSVYGMMNGANSIGKDWMAPINNRLKTNIIGKSEYDIEELVDITLKHINM